MEKAYEIGGRIFIQRPCVLKQIKQLYELIEGENAGQVLEGNIDILFSFLIKHGPKFLSIVLTPEGQAIKDKNMDELEGFFEENTDLKVYSEVVQDFFEFNRVLSLIQTLMTSILKSQQESIQKS